MVCPDRNQKAFLERHRVARLATADRKGRPHAVPICYACEGACLYFAVDQKPKRVAPTELKRLRNIRANPQVAVVIDDYSEDWSELAYLLIHGIAEVLEGGEEHARALSLLAAKYPQYRSMKLDGRPVVRIIAEKLVSWRARS